MSRPHDTIVIGAGHNGLTAALLLARRGERVVVLERASRIGGLAASHEFHPGYRSAGMLHDTTCLRRDVVRTLGLEKQGLRWRDRAPSVLALDGGPQTRDDAADLKRLRDWIAVVRPALRRQLDEPPLDWIGLGTDDWLRTLRHATSLRRLGRRTMLELLRVPPQCVADWLGEWIQDGPLAATMALPAVAAGFVGPRAPGTAANLLLREVAAGEGVSGDGPALVAALASAASEAGVEIRTTAAVERILLDRGAVAGVELSGGERVSCRRIAASCDPKQLFVRLLPSEGVPGILRRRIEALRTRGTTARVLLALAGRLEFADRPGERIALARTGGCLDDLERAFDALKYRQLPETPILEVHLPTIESPTLAPEGCDVVSILVHAVPAIPDGGWSDDRRRLLLDRVLGILETHAPGVGTLVAGYELATPPDIEDRYGCTDGQLHHVEHALDQLLVRPVPGCTGYRTPIEGLWLCGSGSHPGGGLTCGPGALAAAAMAGRRSARPA